MKISTREAALIFTFPPDSPAICQSCLFRYGLDICTDPAVHRSLCLLCPIKRLGPRSCVICMWSTSVPERHLWRRRRLFRPCRQRPGVRAGGRFQSSSHRRIAVKTSVWGNQLPARLCSLPFSTGPKLPETWSGMGSRRLPVFHLLPAWPLLSATEFRRRQHRLG